MTEQCQNSKKMCLEGGVGGVSTVPIPMDIDKIRVYVCEFLITVSIILQSHCLFVFESYSS